MSFPRPARFCPYCATRLVRRDDHGVRRPTCPECGYIAYQNPSPAVGVIFPRDDGIVLVKRKFEPYAGQWSLPAGFMEYGESPEHTAKREIMEETGFEVELDGLIGAYRGTDDPRIKVVLLIYRGHIVGGRAQPGDDASDLKVFAVDDLPENLAFRSHKRAIRDYKKILAHELQ